MCSISCFWIFFILFKSRLPTVLLDDNKGMNEEALSSARRCSWCCVCEVLTGLQGDAFSEDLAYLCNLESQKVARMARGLGSARLYSL